MSKDLIVIIDPTCKRRSHHVGGKSYRAGVVYSVKAARAKALEKVYMTNGRPESGRVFLVMTEEQARAREQALLAQAHAPRGSIDLPVRVLEEEPKASPKKEKPNAASPR